MNRARGIRQGQAAPLSRERVDRMIAAGGNRMRDLRDVALLAVAYDTLARRSEILALDLGDVAVAEDGSGTVLIQRSKADQDGAGQVRFLARDTVAALYGWLSGAAIDAHSFTSFLRGRFDP